MAGVIESISSVLSDFYNYIVSILPLWMQNFVGLFLLVVLVFIYSIFIWKLHKFISKKNIFSLDLHQYNKSEHPFLSKLFAIGFYVLEYVIILPIIILFWFIIFALFLILMTKDIPVETILMLSATIVGVIRMTAYYKEDLSKEIAKLFPLTLLAVAMTTQGLFDFSKIFPQFAQIPSLFGNIITYLIFIVVLEILLRFFDFILSLFNLEDSDEQKD